MGKQPRHPKPVVAGLRRAFIAITIAIAIAIVIIIRLEKDRESIIPSSEVAEESWSKVPCRVDRGSSIQAKAGKIF